MEFGLHLGGFWLIFLHIWGGGLGDQLIEGDWTIFRQ